MVNLNINNKDISYCSSTNCLHRLGCKRWLRNYNSYGYVLNMIDGVRCQSMKYYMLIRFRNSDGSGGVGV